MSVLSDSNPRQLEAELRAIPGWPDSGLPLAGLDERGDVVLYGELTDAQRAAARTVIANHVPNPDYGLDADDRAAIALLNGAGALTAAQVKALLRWLARKAFEDVRARVP